MDWLAAALPFVSSFNANQNSRMNSREARQWEEDMYNRYNSPSALVRQYNEANINPALMFGQPTPAAPTDTSAAETFPTETGSVTEMLGQLMDLTMLGDRQEELRLRNAGTRIANAIAEKFGEKEADAKIRQMNATIDKMRSDIDLNKSQSLLNDALTELNKVRKDNEAYDKVRKEWEKKFIERLGVSPEFAGQILDTFGDFIAAGLDSLFDGSIGSLIKWLFGSGNNGNGPIPPSGGIPLPVPAG